MMKNLLVVIIFLNFTTTCIAQTKPEAINRKDAIYMGFKQLIETQQYQFKGNWLMLEERRFELNNSLNILVIDKGSVSAKLNGEEGYAQPIISKGELSDYKVTYNDDLREINIGFSLGNRVFNIEIKNSGKVFLRHKSQNDEIIWIGSLSKL